MIWLLNIDQPLGCSFLDDKADAVALLWKRLFFQINCFIRFDIQRASCQGLQLTIMLVLEDCTDYLVDWSDKKSCTHGKLFNLITFVLRCTEDVLLSSSSQQPNSASNCAGQVVLPPWLLWIQLFKLQEESRISPMWDEWSPILSYLQPQSCPVYASQELHKVINVSNLQCYTNTQFNARDQNVATRPIYSFIVEGEAGTLATEIGKPSLSVGCKLQVTPCHCIDAQSSTSASQRLRI